MRNLCARSAIACLVLAMGLVLGPIRAYSAPIDIWISADNRFDLYTGTPTATTSFIGGSNDWTVANNYSFNLPSGYLYAPAADVGVVYGLGGYLSLDGGANYTPILPGTGWEVALVGSSSLPWPNQATVDSRIAAANSNNDWVAAGPGSAFPGFGLPANYGSVTRPTLGSIWHPTAGSNTTLLFRYHVVPEPSSIVVLMIGIVTIVGWQRKSHRSTFR